MTVLRDDLLAGRAVALAGSVQSGPVRELLLALGADVLELGSAAELDDQQAADWVRERAPVEALVYDAGGAFGEGGQVALAATLEAAWSAVAAVANGALIGSGKPGKIVLIAPRAGAGPHAEAARSALENLARTLSVEWARYRLTATAIWPGASARAGEIAELVAFLLSPAGDYYSGCRFELGRD